MTATAFAPLLVGEVFIDVTTGENIKVRLGGIVHAARGFWAQQINFGAAIIVPEYLETIAIEHLNKLGCELSVVLGHIKGAPNVMLASDPTEVSDQRYENLLRHEKSVALSGNNLDILAKYSDALIFPGSYDLKAVCAKLPTSMAVHIDAAYDVENVSSLQQLNRPISTIFISTSSTLFDLTGTQGIDALASSFASLNLDALVLKENRGGCRLRVFPNGATERIPAQLGATANSIGVGDVFDSTYLANLDKGPVEAAWRAASASSSYAQTIEVDQFATYVRRDSKLSLQELKDLGGTFLAWEDRRRLPVYLAAPDFATGRREAIDSALSALQYHNFTVRRPVVENGQIPTDSDLIVLRETYR